MLADNKDTGAKTDEKFWNDQWSDIGARGWLNKLVHQRDHGPDGFFLKMIRANVPDLDLRNANLVEIGGAASNNLLDFAKEGAAITAVDYSDVGVERSKVMLQQAGVTGRVIKADMFTWNDENGTFDIVTHWGLLEHFEDIAKVFEVSSRLLKPNGMLVFSMPNLFASGARFWRDYSPTNYAVHIAHSDKKIEAACKATGFQLVKKFYFGIPLLRMAPMERKGAIPFLINILHVGLNVVKAIFPRLFINGTLQRSMNRGFVLRKM